MASLIRRENLWGGLIPTFVVGTEVDMVADEKAHKVVKDVAKVAPVILVGKVNLV